MYGSEVWQLKQKKNKGELLTMKMDFWRRSAGISCINKVRNEIIISKMKVKNTILNEINMIQPRPKNGGQ